TPNRLSGYLLDRRRAAQRAFISWESLRRPAGVIPLCFLPLVECDFCFAHRARAAAAILARAAADILRRGRPAAAFRSDVSPRIALRRFSNRSMARRMESALSKAVTDMSMRAS